MSTHDETRVKLLSEEEFNLFEKKLLTFKRGSDRVRTSLSEDVKDEDVRPSFRTEKTLRRESHLELLMFSVIDFVSETLGTVTEGECFESATYAELRALSKSLARGRRPDGSKY